MYYQGIIKNVSGVWFHYRISRRSLQNVDYSLILYDMSDGKLSEKEELITAAFTSDKGYVWEFYSTVQ